MTPHARNRQQRYRERRKAAGFLRQEVWIPPDVLAEIGKRWKPYGDFSRPQLALIALARHALELPKSSRTARTSPEQSNAKI